MNTRYSLPLFASLIAISLFINGSFSYSQDEMDFEEFMGMMSETFTEEQLDELSYLLPWDIKVHGYAYGDFSGDNKVDVVLAVREKFVTPSKSLDVYFFENVNDKTYNLIKKKNIKWIEIPIEIAFLVKEGLCYVTSRDNSNWYFTSYKISHGEIVKVKNNVYPIEIQKAGE